MTTHLIPNKFSCIGIMNLKCQFESDGFTMNLGEKVSSPITMFKNFWFFLLIFFSTIIIQSSPKRKKKPQKSSTRKYNNKMLVVQTWAKGWWPVKENNFQLIVSAKNSHLCQRLIILQQKFIIWEETCYYAYLQHLLFQTIREYSRFLYVEPN